MAREQITRIALIGYGAIAHEVVTRSARNNRVEIVGALVLEEDLGKPAGFPLTCDGDALFAFKPDLVVECAGHAAVDAYAAPVLKRGLDLMIVSIGALAEREREERIRAAAFAAPGQLYLPAGALIGVDGLGAAKRAGLSQVSLTSRKPPLAWSGAPGVDGRDLDAIDRATSIFSGSAREAALAFPKNANVAATAALAGLGFDRTDVQLVADPGVTGNRHCLEFSGACGQYRVETDGRASEDNPKTSMLTAYSILRAIENRSDALVI